MLRARQQVKVIPVAAAAAAEANVERVPVLRNEVHDKSPYARLLVRALDH